jgi:hypothetical protein
MSFVTLALVLLPFRWSKPERTTDHGQANDELNHLRLRIEYSLFCYLQSRVPTDAVLVICLYHDIADILLKVALNTIKSINQPLHLFVRASERGRKSEQLVNFSSRFRSECKLILYLTKMCIFFC